MSQDTAELAPPAFATGVGSSKDHEVASAGFDNSESSNKRASGAAASFGAYHFTRNESDEKKKKAVAKAERAPPADVIEVAAAKTVAAQSKPSSSEAANSERGADVDNQRVEAAGQPRLGPAVITTDNTLPALESNRPREEWNLSHVKVEFEGGRDAAKVNTHDAEVVDLAFELKASMEPAEHLE